MISKKLFINCNFGCRCLGCHGDKRSASKACSSGADAGEVEEEPGAGIGKPLSPTKTTLNHHDDAGIQGPKQRLNQFCQQRHMSLPCYDIRYPEDAVGYIAMVTVGMETGDGRGVKCSSSVCKSKKEAEVQAALAALERLRLNYDGGNEFEASCSRRTENPHKEETTGMLLSHLLSPSLPPSLSPSLPPSLSPSLPPSLPPPIPHPPHQKSELCIKKTKKQKKCCLIMRTVHAQVVVQWCIACMENNDVCGFFCVCFATCSDKGLLQEPVARARSEKLPPNAHLRDTDNQRWVPVFPHGPHHTRGRGKKRGREHPCGE